MSKTKRGPKERTNKANVMRKEMDKKAAVRMITKRLMLVLMLMTWGQNLTALGNHRDVDDRSVGMLSGDDVNRLLAALAKVESDNGKTSKNVYQLMPEYVSDVNRIQRKETRSDNKEDVSGQKTKRSWTCEDVLDARKSEMMMLAFWRYYSRRMPHGGTMEELAKIHHVGYRGMRTKRSSAEIYWRKIKKELRK